MLRGFLGDVYPLYCGQSARHIIQSGRLLEVESSKGSKMPFSCDNHMLPETPRVALVDSFRDEPGEIVIVAQAMEGRLQSFRLDTPSELGGVTVDLVNATRSKLSDAGFAEVAIY